MALDGYGVSNFRSFVDQAQVELRPLTLLFGYNGVGKSALLRMLPLVYHSLHTDGGEPLSTASPAARGATFAELRSALSSAPVMTLTLQTAEPGRPAIEYRIRDLPERRRQVVETLTLSDAVDTFSLEWDAEVDGRYDASTGGKVQLSMSGLMPQWRGGSDDWQQRIASVTKRLAAIDVHWLTALRTVPARRLPFRAAPRRMDPSGEQAAPFLAYDRLDNGHLLRAVSQWFAQNLRHRVEIVTEASNMGEEFWPALVPVQASSSPVRVHLAQSGEGLAQVLPVVVLTQLARLGRVQPGALLAIEHPELHLHPGAHAAVAELLVQAAVEGDGCRLLVETHSENILLRVQLAVARGQINPKDVIIYWVRQLPDGRSVVDPIELDAEARPQGAGWPPDVFAEDLKQARELVRLRLKPSKADG
ncbi:MAG: AAA family ATPase [Myxococcota bacterium]